MDWQIAFTLAVVALALFGMSREIAAPDIIMMGALVTLAMVGILTPEEAFAGLSNQSVVAIGILFIVSSALRSTGALDLALGRLMGRARTVRSGIARICAPVALGSAFLNNAPIVAMMTPAVIDWSRRVHISPSRFLMPLSYAAILGSSTTMIGTSVNLTVAGLMSEAGMRDMGFFELTAVGLPIALAGLAFLVFVAPRLLPDRVDPSDALGARRREYVIAMRVEEDCPLVGQSVEDAGLRQLPGLFLVEIDRSGRVITPVAPDVQILAGDQLVFAGVVSTIVDLQRIRGLVPLSEEESSATGSRNHRLVEAVMSSSSPLIGRTIRDSNFRTVYDAAVIAVHRNGERVAGKIGAIAMRTGDTLLMQTAPGFMRAHRNSPDFLLVSDIGGTEKPRYDRAWLAIAILVAMVVAVATGVVPIAVAACGAAGALVVTRCITGPEARMSVQWSILIVIAAGLGVAHAMDKTGAASLIARGLLSAAGNESPWLALALIYCLCLAMAEMLHHNAAAAIMFPVAVATATQLGVDPRGFVMAVAVGSCCAFASPVTYQTHLIVYGPGGYRFGDFVRVGIWLDGLAGIIAIALIPRIWPF